MALASSVPAGMSGNNYGFSAIFDMATAPGGIGLDALESGFADAFREKFVGAVMDTIKTRGQEIPTAQMDIIEDNLENSVAGNQCHCGADIQEILDMVGDEMKEMAQEAAQEVSDEAAASSGGGAGENNGAGGKGEVSNWLVMLARAMSELAGDQLGKLINKQDELSTLEGKFATLTDEQKKEGGTSLGLQAERMTELTGEIQAHTHMFKMLQETMSTAIKSIGEALSGAVRKQ